MHERELPAPSKAGSAHSAAADVLWVVSFVVTWGLLVACWDTRWAIPLVPLLVCHLGGLSEFVHQAVHLNLFARDRGWNRRLGRIAAAILCMDFDTYRTFHLDHHRYVNTPDDPERPIYADPALLAIGAGWENLTSARKIARTFRLARYVAGALGSFGGKLPFVRAIRWGIPALIAAAAALGGLAPSMILAKLVIVWFLPLFLLLWVDIVFAQSEHYATPEIERPASGIVPLEVQYAHSWNLKMPRILEFHFLKRNIHAEHHLTPSLHWTQARDRGKGRQLGFRHYLLMLWKRGPRTIAPQEHAANP